MGHTNDGEQGDVNVLIEQKEKHTHFDPLFRMFDHFVTQKLGGNESLDTVI